VLQDCEENNNVFQAQYYWRNYSIFSPFDYAHPVPISEDARQAVNVSILCRQNHQLLVELVSKDGMERVVAAGILSFRIRNKCSTSPKKDIWNRFSEFKNQICSKCAEVGDLECGCEFGNTTSNKAFNVLKDYTENYVHWLEEAYETGRLPKRIVVVLTQEQSFAVQHRILINSLILAIAMKRVLIVVHKDADLKHHQVALDSVIDFSGIEYDHHGEYYGLCETSFHETFFLSNQPPVSHYDYMMCGNRSSCRPDCCSIHQFLCIVHDVIFRTPALVIFSCYFPIQRTASG